MRILAPPATNPTSSRLQFATNDQHHRPSEVAADLRSNRRGADQDQARADVGIMCPGGGLLPGRVIEALPAWGMVFDWTNWAQLASPEAQGRDDRW